MDPQENLAYVHPDWPGLYFLNGKFYHYKTGRPVGLRRNTHRRALNIPGEPPVLKVLWEFFCGSKVEPGNIIVRRNGDKNDYQTPSNLIKFESFAAMARSGFGSVNRPKERYVTRPRKTAWGLTETAKFLKKKHHLSEAMATRLVKGYFETLLELADKGIEVQLTDLGTFKKVDNDYILELDNRITPYLKGTRKFVSNVLRRDFD